MRIRVAAACTGLSLLFGIGAGEALAADKITVHGLISDGYSVVSAWMSNIGPGLVLQKADKLFLCFVTEKPEAPEIVTNYCKPVR